MGTAKVVSDLYEFFTWERGQNWDEPSDEEVIIENDVFFTIRLTCEADAQLLANKFTALCMMDDRCDIDGVSYRRAYKEVIPINKPEDGAGVSDVPDCLINRHTKPYPYDCSKCEYSCAGNFPDCTSCEHDEKDGINGEQPCGDCIDEIKCGWQRKVE